MDSIRIALAQINPTVGDFAGNLKIISQAVERAKDEKADIVVFPELAITGYPPEDLLTRPSFTRRCEEALEELAAKITDIVCLVGAPVKNNGLFNAAVALAERKIVGAIYKKELPNYGVFDERRYFIQGDNGPLIKINGAVIGVSICEDIWVDNDILSSQTADGANLLLNISSSPYRLGAGDERRTIVTNRARELSAPFAYCNLVGGQDELVFDGGSFVSDAKGEVIAKAESFKEDVLIVDIELSPQKPVRRRVIECALRPGKKGSIKKAKPPVSLKEDEEIYAALTVGARDYVNKNGFETVVIALSGGVDSALTTTIAVDALGSERVKTIYMPSPYSSDSSFKDAERLALRLSVEMIIMPIGELMAGYESTLTEVFKGRDKGLAEENIQARIRGALVMALSNKFGWLVFTTGNKSEIAVGYCTLYGDTVGGFSVLKDLFKTRVYRLCKWRNEKAGHDLIPQSIIDKAPSAELRPDQLDTDSLPPYDVLDPILQEYIEHDKNIDEIIKSGYSKQLVSSVVSMVDRNEYKRRQGAVGVKITPKAFGRDRRHPITCKFIDE